MRTNNFDAYAVQNNVIKTLRKEKLSRIVDIIFIIIMAILVVSFVGLLVAWFNL